MPLVELDKITKIYDQRKPNEFYALNGVDLSFQKGEFAAIMGISGSGKSTLMNIIGCLDKPTSGSYKFDGEEVTQKRHAELVKIRRNRVGFIFQNFNLLPRRTALSNVELPLIYKSIRPKKRKILATRALEQVGLGSKLKHRPSMLSGGEQQRVAIARAIVNEPVVILADEPTGNLDSKSGRQVMEMLRGLHQKGTTVIVVTHDQKVAEYAQRIININDGKIVS